MRDITIIEQDRPGLLASIASALGRDVINIKRFAAHGVGGNAVITLGVTDVDRALRVLRDNKINAIVEEILIAKIDDKPGQLAEVVLKLKDIGCNLKSAYVVGRSGAQVLVALAVDDTDRARLALGDLVLKSWEE